MLRYLVIPAAVSIAVLSWACSSKGQVAFHVDNEVRSLNHRGEELYRKGNYEGAAKAFDGARLLAAKAGDRAGEAASINHLGGVYLKTGDYGAAEESFEKAYAISEEIESRGGMATSLANLGSMHMELKNPDMAVAAFEEAGRMYRRAGDRLAWAGVLNNLGLVALEEGDQYLAEKHFLKALDIALCLKDRSLAVKTFQNLERVGERQVREGTMADYRRRIKALRQ